MIILFGHSVKNKRNIFKILGDDINKMIDISVFIPVYNEENRLEKNIKKIYDKLKETGYKFEIFIVDDNSKDLTPEIGRELVKKYDEVRFVRYNKGPSRRENLGRSFRFAKGKVIVFMDADIATDLKSFEKLVDSVYKGYDIAIGTRYHKKSRLKRTVKRFIISVIYNSFMRLYFGSRLKDHQCGFKAFKKSVVLDIVKEMGYDSAYVRGWFWDAELLIRAQKKGKKILTIPVRWKEGKTSTFNISNELKMIPYVLKLRSKL